MISALGILAFVVGMGFVIRWLMRYSTRGDVDNGGDPHIGFWGGRGAKDSTVSAYARRSWEMARNAGRQMTGLLARHPTTKAQEPVPEQETETRTGG